MLTFIDRPSPNFDERGKYIADKIIVHYTDMECCEDALIRLTDVESKVSCHYLIDTDGTLYQLVDEEKRAWHAGVSMWASETDINASSIGIELQNTGQQFGYDSFPEAQINALKLLIMDIKTRHPIVRQHILAHSDIAPSRKIDPDYLFPWTELEMQNLVIIPKEIPTEIELIELLDMIGYDIENPTDSIKAFQRRYRPAKIDGIEDTQCRALAFGLIAEFDRI